MVREYTNKLLEALNEGMISHETVAEASLQYMSEDEVKDMVRANDWLFVVDDDDDDD